MTEISKSFTSTEAEQCDIEYTIQVDGDRVAIHRTWAISQEDGDSQHDCWMMSKDTLKKFIQAAQWAYDEGE